MGGFLTRELDFYIKNELMQWEDLAALKNTPALLAPLLSKLDVIRELGSKIITFLAQLENFQKKLWLKKKFVTETNYCITLDRVPEALYEEICNNAAQHDEWVRLFAIDEIKGDLTSPAYSNPLTVEFLQTNQNLVLDTQFFDENFKAQIIASIEDFDEQCDGLLIHSENFQALSLLQERYREQVKCIYIDPPYNTAATEIVYKNSYKHSSWLSLMSSRLASSMSLQSSNAFIFIAIDDLELFKLNELVESYYTRENFIANVSVVHKPEGRNQEKFFGTSNEYMLVYTKDKKEAVFNNVILDETHAEKYSLNDEQGSYRLKNFIRLTDGKYATREAKPDFYYPIYVSSDLTKVSIVNIDGYLSVYPITEAGVERTWKTKPNTFLEYWKSGNIEIKQEGSKLTIFEKLRESQVIKTHWIKKKYHGYHYGTKPLEEMLGNKLFDFPKSIILVSDVLKLSVKANELVLDYFAGSGTTGHAVINLNREDSGKRKYILTEMGNHFDTVLKPRLAKVAYASEWKGGKPVVRDTGISHCFKYIRLESYEDTLGNLKLNQKQDLFSNASDDEARQAYVMNYMLDVETRGSQSLLNIQQFLDPTQYELNVRSASGDETVPVKVDLLETFNYLLGLEVEHIAAPIYFDAEISQAEFGRWQADVKRNENGKWWFRTVYGTNRNGQQVLVVWRNLPSVIAKAENGLQYDNAVLDAVLVERLRIRLTESLDDPIDVLYVNGDHNISIPRNRAGEPMEQARVQLIEEAFQRLMFADTEAVH